MSRHEVVRKVSFGCQKCKSDQLTGNGAVLVNTGYIYMMYTCDSCGEDVPIPIDNIVAELYPSDKIQQMLDDFVPKGKPH